MNRHLCVICIFLALLLAVLAACGNPGGEADVDEMPSLEECTFERSRVVINGAPDGYSGQKELEQAFDTDVFYYRDHVDSKGKYGYPILMRAGADGTVKAMCTISGCRHDSPGCYAYDDSFGRYFTVGGELYYLKTARQYGDPCLQLYAVTEDSRQQLADLNGSTEYYFSNENAVTDGEWLYLMVSREGAEKTLERVRLSDGTTETLAGFEQLSGGPEDSRVILYPSADGKQVEISGSYGLIELQTVSDDGGYILFVQKLTPFRSTYAALYVMRAFCVYDGTSTVIAVNERRNNDSGSLPGRLYFYKGSIYRVRRREAAFEGRSVSDDSWKLLWDLSVEREKLDSMQLKYFDGTKVIFKGQKNYPYISITAYIYDMESGQVSVNNFKTRSTVLKNRRFPDIFAMSPDHVIIDVVNYEDYTYDLAVMAKADLYAETGQYREIGHVSDFY